MAEGCLCKAERYDEAEPIVCSKCQHQWLRRLNRGELYSLCPVPGHLEAGLDDPRPAGSDISEFKCGKCGYNPYANYRRGPMNMWVPPEEDDEE